MSKEKGEGWGGLRGWLCIVGWVKGVAIGKGWYEGKAGVGVRAGGERCVCLATANTHTHAHTHIQNHSCCFFSAFLQM